jgi:hypothetical protein
MRCQMARPWSNARIGLLAAVLSGFLSWHSSHAAFIENRGQISRNVLYYTQISNARVFVTDEGLIFDIGDTSGLSDAKSVAKPLSPKEWPPQRTTTKRCSLFVRFTGCSSHKSIEPKVKTQTVHNFFYGKDQSKWIRGAPSFEELHLKNLWPAIDMVLVDRRGYLSYDFVLKPGADPHDIVFDYLGGSQVTPSEDAKQLIRFPFGCLVDSKPISEQRIGSIVINSAIISSANCSWVDASLQDLLFSTFLGGEGQDVGFALAADAQGSPIITGYTDSFTFPTTLGAYDNSFNSTDLLLHDVFIAKFDPSGSAPLWSTYLGGMSTELSYAVIIDQFGNAVISGVTVSQDFPTTSGAFCETIHQGATWWQDIFVTKLSSDGSDIIWSTYIGGYERDWANASSIDTSGNVIITGKTDSPDFPVTPGAYNTTYRGGDMYLTKLANNGSAIIWSTFITSGVGNDIVLDSSGNIVVAGTTTYSGYPVTGNAYDTTFNGAYDAVVSMISDTGSEVLWSTFLGGIDWDWASAIRRDEAGDLIIAGLTASDDYPTTAGAYMENFAGGGRDLFVSKIGNDGEQLVWSTYLGGSGAEGQIDVQSGPKMDLDNRDNAIITCQTYSNNFPVTLNGYDMTYNGSWDAVVSIMDDSDGRLLQGSYLGSSSSDIGMDVLYDGRDIYITGYTRSLTAGEDFPVTQGAYDDSYNGNGDVFLVKMSSTVTPVYLNYYMAERSGNVVVIKWTVSYEIEHLGFEVWRQAGNTEIEKVSDEIVAGLGGHEYVDMHPPIEETDYWLKEIGTNGSIQWFGPMKVAAVGDDRERAGIREAAPNPCNPVATIKIEVPSPQRLSVSIYDLAGNFITGLADGIIDRGLRSVTWNGTDSLGRAVPSGTYIVRLEADGNVESRKIVLVR